MVGIYIISVLACLFTACVAYLILWWMARWYFNSHIVSSVFPKRVVLLETYNNGNKKYEIAGRVGFMSVSIKCKKVLTLGAGCAITGRVDYFDYLTIYNQKTAKKSLDIVKFYIDLPQHVRKRVSLCINCGAVCLINKIDHVMCDDVLNADTYVEMVMSMTDIRDKKTRIISVK